MKEAEKEMKTDELNYVVGVVCIVMQAMALRRKRDHKSRQEGLLLVVWHNLWVAENVENFCRSNTAKSLH